MKNKLTETNKNIPSIAAAWQRIGQSHKWAGNAPIPIIMRLKKVSHMMTLQMEQEMDLSLPQMRILFEAYHCPNISQAALHKSYQVDPASITRTVQNMERDGLIVRRPDTKDNRLMQIELTDKGRALAEALPERIAAYELQLTAGLSDSEILQLHSLLERIEAQLLINNENLELVK